MPAFKFSLRIDEVEFVRHELSDRHDFRNRLLFQLVAPKGDPTSHLVTSFDVDCPDQYGHPLAGGSLDPAVVGGYVFQCAEVVRAPGAPVRVQIHHFLDRPRFNPEWLSDFFDILAAVGSTVITFFQKSLKDLLGDRVNLKLGRIVSQKLGFRQLDINVPVAPKPGTTVQPWNGYATDTVAPEDVTYPMYVNPPHHETTILTLCKKGGITAKLKLSCWIEP